jgi:hypothetical protein
MPLHANDGRARSGRLSLRLRERLCPTARTPRCRSSSGGEAAGPVDWRIVRVYGSHTSGDVDAPEVGRIARGFRKCGERNGASLSL